jgi:hypothetical protein
LASCKQNRKPLSNGVDKKQLEKRQVHDSTINGQGDSLQEKPAIFKTRYRFSSFPAVSEKRKIVGPDFSTLPDANDPDFQKRFLRQMDSVNFAGHFTIVFRGCGAMCSNIYIVDRHTGRIFSDLPVNNEGRWGFSFRKDSKLLIANSELIENDTLSRYSKVWQIAPELYEWTGKKLRRLQ